MKTKIIYISGSEVFDVADIRSAFEEVRSALGFGTDTVLFGVPIDSEDAGLQINQIPEIPEVNETLIVEEEDTPEACEDITELKEEIISEPVPEKKPAKKTKIKPESDESEKPVVSEVSEKIIPILSVLSAKKDSEDTDLQINHITETPEVKETLIIEDIDEPVSQEVLAEPEVRTVTTEKFSIQETNTLDANDEIISSKTIVIEEMMIDDMPVAEQDETLEQLFERIAPLREDHNNEEVFEKPKAPVKEEINLDATLEQLANEFAENQDKIVTNPKIESAGKIGKLKNILPFKKAKREETGLMGDLFGWAGIAANDEEFSIPGFFTTSASKK